MYYLNDLDNSFYMHILFSSLEQKLMFFPKINTRHDALIPYQPHLC